MNFTRGAEIEAAHVENAQVQRVLAAIRIGADRYSLPLTVYRSVTEAPLPSPEELIETGEDILAMYAARYGITDPTAAADAHSHWLKTGELPQVLSTH